MTDEQRVQIINLREVGNGYKKIGQILGLSENTVKSFCQRRNLVALSFRQQQAFRFVSAVAKRYHRLLAERKRSSALTAAG